MPDSHDLAFGGFGRDLEAIGTGVALNQQGVVARPGEALGESREYIGILMRDRRGFTVHELVSSHDLTAKMLGNGLMSQAHAEKRNFTGELSDHAQRYARLGGGAGTGGDEHAVGF